MTKPPPDQERAEQATVMTEIKELVARLREDARQMWNTGLVPEGSTPLAEQAASTIEALSTQVEELRGALRPFAKQADNWSPSLADSSGFTLTPMRNPQPGDLVFEKDLTLGDFRKARTLASEQTGG